MKRIKIIFTTTIAFFVIASAVLFNACNTDPCKSIVCKNNGVCRDGKCKCVTGFEGPFCEFKMNEKFLGTWDGYYRCNGLSPKLRTLVIAPEPQPNKVTIYNVFDQINYMTATVDVDKLEMDKQTVGKYEYSGNGFLEGPDLTLFVQQLNLLDTTFNSCVYNGRKYVD